MRMLQDATKDLMLVPFEEMEAFLFEAIGEVQRELRKRHAERKPDLQKVKDGLYENHMMKRP